MTDCGPSPWLGMVDANLNSFGGNRLKASSEMTISGHCDANRNGKDGLKLQPKRAAEAAETDVMTSRTFNSLPNHYKVKASYKMALEGSSDKVIAESKKVNGAEMRKRLDIVMEWFADFDDNQRTIMVEGLLPLLGAPQLHRIADKLPRGGDLHAYCQAGCGDPLQQLPLDIGLKVLGFLGPEDLVSAFKVCHRWKELAESNSLWRDLCFQPKWRLSAQSDEDQLDRHSRPSSFKFSGDRCTTMDILPWRKIFVERFKLRRSWLKGTCHVRTFEGHTGAISCVQFDGARIVSGSHDKTIRVWNIKTNSRWSVLTLVGHSGSVRCLHLESGGNRLVSGSNDHTIKVWDVDIQPEWSSIGCKVTMVGHTDTVRCVHMSTHRGLVISGSYDRTVRLWCLKTGRCKAILEGHAGRVLCLYVPEVTLRPPDRTRGTCRNFHRPNNRFINLNSDLHPSNIFLTGSSDMSIKVWSFEDHRNLITLVGHQDAVTCLSLSETTGKVVSGSLDRTIKLWDLLNGTCLSTLDWMSSEGHTGVIRCLQTDLWRIVSAADDKTIKVWSLETGSRLVTLRSHTDGVTCLRFNDFFIVSGSYDKTVKLWDFTVC